jgi:hypothetical protein
MRYRFLILLLALSLSACSFNVDLVTPSPEVTLPPATAPVAITPTESPVPSVVPTFPTLTPETPGVSPTPLQENNGTYPIRFPPNGTYVDILDSLKAGSTKTYSVNAMQGQIMSISVRVNPNDGWRVIPLKINAADGTILCPTQVNVNCYFWRGVLPSTQEYLITLSPEVDVTFTLRAAVNPPGVSTQSFPYRSIDSVLYLTYTDEFAPVLFPDLAVTKITPEMALQFIDTKSLDHTNLGEAYFVLGSSSDPGVVASCTEPGSFGGPEEITSEVNIDGVPFTRSEASGVGAGNIYEQTFYRTAYQGTCYEITFFIHSTNLGNYPSDSGYREFDRAALMQKFEAILSTLVIK